MLMEEEKKNRLKHPAVRAFFASDRKVWLLLLVVLAGILLLAFSRCSVAKQENGETKNETSGYQSALETRLEKLLCSIEGVGDAEVLITLEQGFQTVYAAGRSRVETVRAPGVKGVVVVCSGGASEAVRTRVTEAIATALGIGWDQVSVQAAKN